MTIKWLENYLWLDLGSSIWHGREYCCGWVTGEYVSAWFLKLGNMFTRLTRLAWLTGLARLTGFPFFNWHLVVCCGNILPAWYIGSLCNRFVLNLFGNRLTALTGLTELSGLTGFTGFTGLNWSLIRQKLDGVDPVDNRPSND